MINKLRSSGIECLKYYVPLDGSENANKLYRTNICLPCHSGLNENDINEIIGIVNAA